MCGIIGSNFSNSTAIAQGLKIIQARGPDHTGMYQKGAVIFGANRLAIQDSSDAYNQPIVNNSHMMVYNGELWKNENIMAHYTNDSQYIFNQYQLYGSKIFSKLDGMFALAFHDPFNNDIILARDFIGEIPLYYYHKNEKFAFASEIKAIQEMDPSITIKEIKLVPPGSSILFQKSVNQIFIDQFYALPSTQITDSRDQIVSNIRKLLTAAVEKRIPDVPYAVLLSGGIDSSIIAYLLREINPNIEAFTINLGNNEKKNQKNDLYWARLVADNLKIKLHEIIVNEDDINNHLHEAIRIAEDQSWTQISSAIPHILMAKKIKEHGYKVIFSGSGSDEVFASYPIERRWSYNTDADYDNARRKLILNINKNNIIRENNCLLSQSIECRTPFLDKEFIEYAINIPPSYRLENKKDKPLLRAAFKEIFSENIINRPKIPEGEGVGIEDMIKAQKINIKTIYKSLFK